MAEQTVELGELDHAVRFLLIYASRERDGGHALLADRLNGLRAELEIERDAIMRRPAWKEKEPRIR